MFPLSGIVMDVREIMSTQRDSASTQKHSPGCRWRRLPALNTNRTFINDLADAVLEALPFAGSMAGSNPSDSLVPLGAHL